ncbi:hypothetical protein GCM10023321_50710 [Pseudonocardia eucalypti]|uniref:Uncharacterized protein n=1 Tax=Pseudonocardia eucalypti TaxID=648755 RepID=A0ABP9QKP2_9PSEU
MPVLGLCGVWPEPVLLLESLPTPSGSSRSETKLSVSVLMAWPRSCWVGRCERCEPCWPVLVLGLRGVWLEPLPLVVKLSVPPVRERGALDQEAGSFSEGLSCWG